MHIGLIGGIGPAATEFYYRNLVRAHVDAGSVLDLTIVHADMRDLVQNISDNAPDKQAEIFLRLTRRLQAAGAEAVAVTSIAGHFCLRELEALSPLPVINAIPADRGGACQSRAAPSRSIGDARRDAIPPIRRRLCCRSRFASRWELRCDP